MVLNNIVEQLVVSFSAMTLAGFLGSLALRSKLCNLYLHDICLTTHKVLPLANVNQVQLSTGEHVLSFLRTEDKMLMTPVGGSLS